MAVPGNLHAGLAVFIFDMSHIDPRNFIFFHKTYIIFRLVFTCVLFKEILKL